MVGRLAPSRRVIFAAGAAMVACPSTSALCGPLPPKRMGMIFGSGAAGRGARGPMLLPILLRLTGWAAWWLPAWLDRFLSDVRFGH